MADTTLQGTLTNTLPSNALPSDPTQMPALPSALTAPKLSGNLNSDIRTLKGAQADPGSLVKFQQIMQLTSQEAYKERQASELGTLEKSFDPSKVSGGTFAGILGAVEGRRGFDIGKVYAANVNAYASAQEQITQRLQFMEQLKEQRKQFNTEMKFKKKQLQADAKAGKASAKLELKKFNETVRQWEKEFALEQYKATKGASGGSKNWWEPDN